MAKYESTPAAPPISTADRGPTKPAPGVTVAKPATAPLATPRTVGLPRCIHSTVIQAIAAVEAARWVATRAPTAMALAALALPALKPNHPTHNSPVPTRTNGRLCGAI